jgi:hypothetical protein
VVTVVLIVVVELEVEDSVVVEYTGGKLSVIVRGPSEPAPLPVFGTPARRLRPLNWLLENVSFLEDGSHRN